jgi:hypothetical protein
LKISGLDSLQKKMGELEKAMAELDGELGSVSFDPEDPSSIEQAIRDMEAVVDKRIGRYADNDMVAGIVDATKEQFRASILEKAAKARLEADDE